jgi:hypothetical protein
LSRSAAFLLYSECDSKISLPGVVLYLGYLRVRYTEDFLKVPYAVADIVGMSLGRHFDRAVRQISNRPGQLTAACDAQGRESKSNALDTAFEYYVFGDISHLRIPFKTFRFFNAKSVKSKQCNKFLPLRRVLLKGPAFVLFGLGFYLLRTVSA